MLIGNLTRDPNLRYTPNNTAVCSFGLATNRSWTPADGGEKQEKVEFHNIVAWSKLAELCGQLLHKGDKVYVDGRLQTREWKSDDGGDRRTTEVVIENMILLRSRGEGSYSTSSGTGASSGNQGSKNVTDDTKADDSKTNDDASTKPEPVNDDTEAEDVSDDVPF